MKTNNLLCTSITFLLLICMGSFFGCTSTTKVAVMKPAEINLKGVNKIVIGDISGNSGQDLANALTSELFNSNKYEVLDRANLNQVMAEHRLSASGLMNEDTAVKLGNIIGASALITGNSNTKIERGSYRGDGWRDRYGKYHQTFYKQAKAKAKAALKLIDLKTGKILAVKNLSDEKYDENRETDAWPPSPDSDILREKAINTLVFEFMKAIAPYKAYVNVSFGSPATPSGENGIKLAQNGLWDDALNAFQAEVNSKPDNADSHYNLGLAYQYTYDFDNALACFNKCNRIKVDNKYIQAIKSVEHMRSDQRKLQAQQSM